MTVLGPHIELSEVKEMLHGLHLGGGDGERAGDVDVITEMP